MTNERAKLKIGSIKFLTGGSTKVEVIGNIEGEKPLVKILEATIHSKFRVNQEVHVSRRLLYPYHGRRGSKVLEMQGEKSA